MEEQDADCGHQVADQRGGGAEAEEKVKQEERQAAVSLYSDDRLKEEITKRPALRSLDFSPQAFSDTKFREVKGDIQRVLALEDPSDEAALAGRHAEKDTPCSGENREPRVPGASFKTTAEGSRGLAKGTVA